MLHMVKFIVFFNWILMLFASQDMLNFLNPILLKTLNFLKQVQKMKRISKLGNPKELKKKEVLVLIF